MNIDPDEDPPALAAATRESQGGISDPTTTYRLLTLDEMEEIEVQALERAVAERTALRASSPAERAKSPDAHEPSPPLWPTMIPPRLRRQLEATLSARNVEAADIWTDLREWLIEQGVQPPSGSTATAKIWGEDA